METKKSSAKKHLIGVKIGSAREFFVFNTKKQANDYVKVLKKEYKHTPNLEVIQTVKPTNL